MTLPPSHAESAPQQVVQICVRPNNRSTHGQRRVPYDVTLTREPRNAPLKDYIGELARDIERKIRIAVSAKLR